MTYFMFYSPKMSIYSEFDSHKFKFLNAQSRVPFLSVRQTLCDDVLHILNFGALIIHFIRLETWFYANNIFKYDFFYVYSPQMSLYFEFGSHKFKFLKAPSPCFIFKSTGQFYMIVYCIF